MATQNNLNLASRHSVIKSVPPSSRPSYDEINESLFIEKVRREVSCWIWIASISYDGYGQFRVNKNTYKAHRIAYILWVGDIPKGLVVHHTCKNKLCVNPKHLEIINVKESVNRSSRALPLNKEYCVNGHKLTPDNVYMHPQPSGRKSRDCLTCRRIKDRERHLRVKTAAFERPESKLRVKKNAPDGDERSSDV